MRALVLQHIACEPPGAYEDVLIDRGAEIYRVELDAGEPLPSWREVNLIVAMGGPMSVNDDDELRWLTAEKRLIAEAVRAGMPYWGVCLGVQLLAASLGARVYPGPQPEVGLMPVTLTKDAMTDPVFRGLPREFTTLQWHGDTFDLPDGATPLASSTAYPHQAFRWGPKAYGVQFHLEVSADMAREWARVPTYGTYLDHVLGPGALPRLIEELGKREAELTSHARGMFERWLEATVGAPGPN